MAVGFRPCKISAAPAVVTLLAAVLKGKRPAAIRRGSDAVIAWAPGPRLCVGMHIKKAWPLKAVAMAPEWCSARQLCAIGTPCAQPQEVPSFHRTAPTLSPVSLSRLIAQLSLFRPVIICTRTFSGHL
jgi:hypothetical protein